MESDASTASASDARMAYQARISKLPPALFKTYFDNPRMSDIKIILSGHRIVQLHKIVLCRGSEYFSNLLADEVCLSTVLLSLPHTDPELGY